MNNQMMRRLLALALSALMLLGSCSIAETVPAVAAESAPAVRELAPDVTAEPAAEEPAVNALAEPAAEEPAETAAEEPVAGEAAAEEGVNKAAVEPENTPESTTETTPVPTTETTPTPTAVPGETVKEAIAIQEIRLPEKIEIFAREEYQLVPELLPEGAQGKLSYRMDNPNVATVDENGLLRADMEGTSFVVVTAENGVSASCTVQTVHNPVGKIPVEEIVLPEEVRIVEGRSQMIHVKLLPEGAYEQLTYSIADPELAVVSENGWVDAIRPGTTELTVTSYTGKTARTLLIIEQEGAEYYEISNGVLTKYKGGAHYVNVPEGVTAIGSKAFAERYDLWEVTLPASLERIEYGAFAQCRNLKKVVMADGVTSIGDYCFEDCYALSSVRLSASMAEIGKSAFEDCTSLSAIELPSSLRSIGATAFNRCSALKEIALPDVTYIGGGAFTNTAITELTVPGSLGRITTAFLPSNVETVKLCEGITAIEQWDFVTEQPLKRLELPYSLASIADSFMNYYGGGVTVYGPGGGDVQAYFEKIGRKFVPYDDVTVTGDFRIEDNVLVEYTGKGGRVVIPEQVTKIGDNAFYGRSDVTEVVFHDGVTWIGYRAFLNCTGLTELNLPSKLERLEFYAFTGCTGLTHVEIPGSVKSFAGVFNRCTGLESVVIGEGVTACGSFEDCVNLKQVKLPSSLTRLYDNCFMGCTSLAEIQIPAGVTAIQGNCFRGCTALTEIALPSGLQELGYSAFENCTNLRSIKVPDKVSEIESHTFRGCTSLTSVTLPEGLKTITGGSFAGCTSLKELYVPASVKEILYAEQPYIDGPVFANCPNLTVYGMKGSAIQQYCVKAGVPFKVLDASAASISFPEGNLTLGVGQKYTPEIRVDSMAGLGDVSFSSSSSRVTVNKTTGALTAKRTGTATITAKTKNGTKASYKVTVKAAPKSISFKEKNITVMVGEEFRVEYVLPANTAASVSFKEENPYSVLEIHDDGTFRMIDPETTTLRVTTHNGKSATCTIRAVTEPTALYVDRERITLRQTRGDVIVPSVNPESYCRSYAFASSDPEIVTVDEEGRILGVNQGTAEITVTIPTVPGLKAVCRVTVVAPPPPVSLAAEKLTLGLNEKFDLNVGYITDEADYNAPFSCKSSNSKYVTVSADGVVTAKRAGSATITVTSLDGVSAVCAVTVKRAPSSVKISPTKGDLAVGDSGVFKWTLSSGSAGRVRFESSDPAVLEVADDGTAVAKAPGTAKVRVLTYNGKSATASITVHPAPERVAFTKNGDPMRFAIGMKGKLNAVLYPSDFGGRSFASSNPGVISIDEKTGAYAVHSMGECDLTVTAYNGVSETRHAKVYVAPDYIKAVDTKLTLGVGESYRMRIRCEAPYGQECEPGFSYRSSSTKVATVDENGVITAKKTGSATITATSFNGMKVSCKVTVKKAPTSLKLNATELTLGKNEGFQLRATLAPSGCGGVIRYETSNSNQAFVDETGWIHANGHDGTVVITASTYNGLTASCTVTLGREPSSISFPVDRLEMYVGMKLDPQLQVNGGVCSSFKVMSTSPSVAYMDSYGRIVAKKKGRAEIYVESYNGCGASLYVTVAAAPSRCYLDLPGTLNVGYLYNLPNHFRTSPETDPWLSFDSAKVSNDCAVILENAGSVYLMPVKAGSFSVTVKSYNGKSVKKTFKAVEKDLPIEPEIVSPVRTDAQRADYLGSWELTGVCTDGMTLPPEMLDLQGGAITVGDIKLEMLLDGQRMELDYRIKSGQLVMEDPYAKELLRCTLHENGMLSLPLEEDVTLWYRRA
ncbi:MAG: leucine-rich repeat protein [Clostridia bacterium]|nr:leucine-rich repeat protein [Clostridia bacterium]